MPHFTLEYDGAGFVLSLQTMAGTVMYKFGTVDEVFVFLQALALAVEIAG